MSRSIKDLYVYALAEGEGVGTAYEYFVKRAVMKPLLDALAPRARVLVAGLPERYGTSVDFLLAAWERGSTATVVDDRAAALVRTGETLERLRGLGCLEGLEVDIKAIPSLLDVGASGNYDVVLSCEVVQRVDAAQRAHYIAALRRAAPAGMVFAPNAENGSHLRVSGLAGLDRATLAGLFGGAADRVGFVNLPPFPPGIKRSEAQRSRAATGWKEGLAMRGLQAYALAEPHVPLAVKRRIAHIVFAAWGMPR